MSRTVTLTLESIDILQILDALESRAEAYEKTSALFGGRKARLKKGQDTIDSLFIPEECKDAYEANEIAKHFRDIIETINRQFD
jgi:hypothetical protein